MSDPTTLTFSSLRVEGPGVAGATIQLYFGYISDWILGTPPLQAQGPTLSWDGEYAAEVAEDASNRTVFIAVYNPAAGNVIGWGQFELTITSGGRAAVQNLTISAGEVTLGGRLLIEPPQPRNSLPSAPPARPASSRAVVRREMRTMSREEQLRFCRAVEKMMENTRGEQSSEFFRLASYHGWPGRVLCAHGNETFPAWHRGYLVAFEQALQVADRQLGGDGRIGLPYWDCATTRINGEVLPSVLREYFEQRNGPHATVRALISDPQGRPPARQLWQLGYSNMNPDFVIAQHLEAADIPQLTNRALWVSQHWRAASSEGDSRLAASRAENSIEKPHDDVHGFCGYPMNVIDFAAYHPLFWLHHCNIDRLYEAYLAVQGRDESLREYRARQATRPTDMFERWLAPFTHPATGDNLLPADTFDTRALGYQYDALQQRTPQRLTEPPTLALFKEIHPLKFKGTSVSVYVLAFPSAEAAKKARPPKDRAALLAHPHFAGVAVVFAGLTGKCDNCLTRPPYSLSVDISKRVRALGVTRHEAAARADTATSFAAAPPQQSRTAAWRAPRSSAAAYPAAWRRRRSPVCSRRAGVARLRVRGRGGHPRAARADGRARRLLNRSSSRCSHSPLPARPVASFGFGLLTTLQRIN